MRFIFAMIVCCAGSVFAEGPFGVPPVDLRPGEFVDGALFSVKIVPAAKETSFYVVGKQAAKVKLDHLKIQLIMDPEGARKTFSLKRKKDAFVFGQTISKDSHLEIQDEEGRVDQLRIKATP